MPESFSLSKELSRYEFCLIREETVPGKEIYMGTLEKGNDILYTAWWFDNGKSKTVRQLEWRWKSLKGEGEFVLINISTTTEQELRSKITELIESDLKEEK